MVLSDERVQRISDYLLADTERAKRLVDLSPENAVLDMNADGNDFTVEELREFGGQMQAYAAQSANGELSEDALSDVAGGIVVSSAVFAAGVGLFTAGVTFGYTVARDRGW